MSVDALYVRAYMMDSDTSEEDKITALVQVLQSIDTGKAFPQLLIDALSSVCIVCVRMSPSTVLIANRDLRR